MKASWWLYGLLVTVALAVSLSAQDPGADSPVPSVTNRGPRGAAVLATWLEAAGARVTAHDAPLTALPAGTKVVVLLAPVGDEVRPDEVQALERFVAGGGTLVYLAPRNTAQPELSRWLELKPGQTAPLVRTPGLDDVGGSTVAVTIARGPLAGARHLRVSAEQTVDVRLPEAVPVAAHGALWWAPRGEGEFWIGAGPDLAENARLELADNWRFWSQLASRGPIVVDEFHHRRGAGGVPPNLAVIVAQLGLCALAFAWAKGSRLGPPRDPPPGQHRSALEYVRAMAALTRNAGVEAELVPALRQRLRRALHEELGVPLSWSWDEAATEAARRLSLEPAEVLAVGAETDFVRLSRRVAKLEAALRSAA